MKKLFALILAVIMVMSLVACGTTEPATTTAPKDTTPAGTQPAGTTAAATTTEPVVDLKAFPWVEPGSVKITLGLQTNATVLDYNDNYLTKYLEEKTGLDIEFVFFSSDGAEAVQQLNLMVAGKEKLPDMICGISQAMIREWGADGFLYDLAPFFEQGLNVYSKEAHAILPDDVEARLWATAYSEDGGIYGFPTVTAGGTIDSLVFAGFINKTFAKNVGMNADEIDTVDELYQYLTKVVNEDGNGNGKKDEIGMLGTMKNNINKVELQVINAYVQFNEKFVFNVTDGKVWSPLCTDEYRQALITLNKWYKEGLISPLSYTLTDHAEQKAMVDTPDNYTVGVWYGHPTNVIDADSKIGLEYQAMPALQDETGLGGYYTRVDSTKVDMTCAISATCEHPELAFRLFDLMTEPYTAKVMRYGEEGVNWKLLDMEESEKNGLLTADGLPAGVEVIKDEWAEATKATWHAGILNAEAPGAWKHGLAINAGAAVIKPEHRNALSMGAYLNALERGEPAEVLKSVAYNDKEQEVIDTYEKGLKAYFKEARAQFVSGVMDPNNDADWEKYLKELAANGEEELMEAKQSAYDRLMDFLN